MDAAVAALVGAGIGVFGSLGATWLQQRHQTRRDLSRIAVEIATADYQRMLDATTRDGGGLVPPVTVYVAYHERALRAIADGKFTPAEIARIEQWMSELMNALPSRGSKNESQ